MCKKGDTHDYEFMFMHIFEMMMDFSAWSHKRKHTNIFATLLVVGITGLVGWVIFIVTQKKLAQNLKDIHLDLICLAVFFVFTALGLFVYFKTRFRIDAGYKNGEFVLEVNDPWLEKPMVIRNAYIISCEWVYQYVGMRKRMRVLFLTVKKPGGVPIVSFSCMLGSIYSIPANFEYKGDSVHQLALAEKMYDLKGTAKLAEILRSHLEKSLKGQQKV